MTQYSKDGTAYDLYGQKDRPMVVLIHGLGLCRELWSDFLPEISANYQVLSYDLFGHGESGPTPSAASLSIYSKQILSLMDTHGVQRAHIVGFSIGGMINRRFAMDFPDRLASLTILNSPHDRGEDAQLQVEARAKLVREQGPNATMDEALKRWFTQGYLESNGAGVSNVKAWRQLVDPESYAQAAWVLGNGVRELTNPDILISSPALVMTCENDSGSTPQMTHDIAKEIPGSQTAIIPELRHLGLMEKPNLFIRPILDFIDEQAK